MARERDFQHALSRWMEFRLPHIVRRGVDIPVNIKSIISIIGVRRSGKTYMMYQTIKQLQETIPRNNILYINFEDERLRNLDANDLNDMLKVFYMMGRPVEGREIYLFLDEIHSVRDWDKWIRRIYDMENYRIYISGSSSKLLSREISTSLRGRSIDYIIFPFSFTEFLKTKKIVIERPELLSYLEERGRVIGYLNEYMEYGGYPEVVLEEDINIKTKLLQSYYNAIFYRDVVERYNIRSPSLLDIFLRYCIANHSKYISISRVYNFIKTMGYKVGKATLIEYLKYIEEAFFLFPLEIFSYSIKDRKQYPRKIYIIDTGFIKALNIDTNIGRLMENIVYIDLLRRSEYKNRFQVYYWKDKKQREVDFIIRKGINTTRLIQVTYASGRDEIERGEINGLLKAGEELRCKNLDIITWDLQDEIIINGNRITLIPLWRWLLDNSYL